LSLAYTSTIAPPRPNRQADSLRHEAAPAVIIRHALRNALIPVVTASGIQFALLMGGAVIVETVFAWPGVGSLAVSAINNRDVALVVSATFVFAVFILVVNLLVDLSYGLVDPRIRLAS